MVGMESSMTSDVNDDLIDNTFRTDVSSVISDGEFGTIVTVNGCCEESLELPASALSANHLNLDSGTTTNNGNNKYISVIDIHGDSSSSNPTSLYATLNNENDVSIIHLQSSLSSSNEKDNKTSCNESESGQSSIGAVAVDSVIVSDGNNKIREKLRRTRSGSVEYWNQDDPILVLDDACIFDFLDKSNFDVCMFLKYILPYYLHYFSQVFSGPLLR